jgi:hypothetical protein
MKIKKFNEAEDFTQEPIGGHVIKALKSKKYLDIYAFETKMPQDVRRCFFDHYEHVGNDSWVCYDVGESSENSFYEAEMNSDEKIKWNKENIAKHGSILDKWLLKNTDLELSEEVFINHCW